MLRITRRHLCFGIAVVFVVAAVIVPAAGAGNFGPKDPWYMYGVSLTNQLRHDQSVDSQAGGVQPTSPWYAYDAALRKAKQKRLAQSVKTQVGSIQPTSPWYAYDAALRKAQKQRSVQSVGVRIITDTLGGNGSTPAKAMSKTSGTHGNRFTTDTLGPIGALEGSAIPNRAQ